MWYILYRFLFNDEVQARKISDKMEESDLSTLLNTAYWILLIWALLGF